MKLGRATCLLMCILVIATAFASADRGGRKGGRGGRNKNRKGNRHGKKGLRWKNSSLPKRRFEALFEEDRLELDCKVSGKPKPTTTWLKDGQDLQASDHIMLKKHRLIVPEATEADSGNYTCMVSNGRDQLHWTFIVEVRKKIWPLRIVGPENITARVGSDVEFTCKVINDETALLRWKKLKVDEEGRVVEDLTFMPTLQFESGVLRLENIQKEDEGVYACEGSNNGGSRQSQGNLTVLDPIGSEMGRSEDKVSGRGSEKSEAKSKNRNHNRLDKDPLVEKTVETGEVEADFGPDMGTNRRRGKGRKNKGGRRNRNRGKNRKNKIKKKTKQTTPFYFETRPTQASTTSRRMIAAKTTEIQIMYDPYKTTTPEIWHFGNKDRSNFDDGVRDTRYDPIPREPIDNKGEAAEDDTDKTFKEGDAANAKGSGKNSAKKEGSINAWTIYTIVGAVCGVILLIGLVAVTLTLCCKREDEGVYKSATPV